MFNEINLYVRGRELQRRLEERAKEMEMDARDRQKEREELEELKAKIYANNEVSDPETEYAKVQLLNFRFF